MCARPSCMSGQGLKTSSFPSRTRTNPCTSIPTGPRARDLLEEREIHLPRDQGHDQIGLGRDVRDVLGPERPGERERPADPPLHVRRIVNVLDPRGGRGRRGEDRRPPRPAARPAAGNPRGAAGSRRPRGRPAGARPHRRRRPLHRRPTRSSRPPPGGPWRNARSSRCRSPSALPSVHALLRDAAGRTARRRCRSAGAPSQG